MLDPTSERDEPPGANGAAFILLSVVYRELALSYERACPGEFTRVSRALLARTLETIARLQRDCGEEAGMHATFAALISRVSGAMLEAEEEARSFRLAQGAAAEAGGRLGDALRVA